MRAKPDPLEFIDEIPGEKETRQLRRHRHYRVIVTYVDGGKFARVYSDLKKARKYALRARKSPVVRRVDVRSIS